MKKDGIAVKDVVVLVVGAIFLVVGLLSYSNYSKRKAAEERFKAERARIESETREQEARERARQETEEFERERREAKLAAEREEKARTAERERKRKELEAAEAARRAEQESMEALQRIYDAAKKRFSARFDLADGKALDDAFYDVQEATRTLCVFPSYVDTHEIYEVSTMPKGDIRVSVWAPGKAARDFEVSRFTEMLKKERVAFVNDRGFWVKGVKLAGSSFDIPPRGTDFSLLKESVGDLYDTLVVLDSLPPAIECRVTLKSNSGKTSAVVRVIDYGETLGRADIESVASKVVLKSLKTPVTGKKIPKKKFKRRHVLYDGSMVKKDISGVILVPRNFVFHGTNKHADERFGGNSAGGTYGDGAIAKARRDWEEMKAKAEREELEEARLALEYKTEVETENVRKQAGESVRQELSKDEEIIDSALKKCRLFIETRRPKKNAQSKATTKSS